MEGYIISVDIGTQSIRTALLNLQLDVIDIEIVPQKLMLGSDNIIEQNPNLWWSGVVHGIRSVLARTQILKEDIIGVGVCALMHCPVPIDKQGRLLSNRVALYSDKRSAQIVKEYTIHPDADKIYQLTANIPSTSWLGFKIKWIQRYQPNLYRKTWKFLTASSYIVYCLTGVPSIDPAEASGTFLMDCNNMRWSKTLAKHLGLSLDKLPEIVDADKVIGGVSEVAAGLTGLLPGTPVIVGSGDMPCGLLAAGMTKYEKILLGTGTASGLSCYVASPMMKRELMNLRHVLDGWLSFGSVECSGGALRWFTDTFLSKEKEQAEKSNSKVYTLIDEMAASSHPGASKLLFFPTLLGERNSMGSPKAKGIFFGITMSHTRSDFIRAVLEGIAMSEMRILRVILSQGVTCHDIAIRGGHSSSAIWKQIRSDIYQKNIVTLSDSDNSGLIGTAMLVGKGCGIFEDIVKIVESRMRILNVTRPNSELKEEYQRLQYVYEMAHDQFIEIFDQLDLV